MTRMSLRTLAVPLLMLCAAPALAQDVWHVSPAGGGDGSSWDSPVTLHQALGSAKAGDEVWVQGFETIDSPDKLYTVPDDDEAFTVPSGVSLYGGFRGDETSIDERVTTGKLSEMRYRSVLSGDRSQNDAADESLLIFPGNATRDDNAAHVVVMDLTPTAESGNNNTLPTVIDGFSIAEGHADGNPTDASGWGGGIFVTGDNSGGGAFSITRCFLVNNYARRGGAVYVDKTVVVRPTTSTISYNTVFNNAAGERSSANNSGGGLYVAGAANVVNCEVFNNENGGIAIAPAAAVINSTVARNTGSGIEKIDDGTGDAYVYNTVIWGNSYLYSTLSPRFIHSAYHEVQLSGDETVDADGNRYVSDRNRGDDVAVPMFESPSLRTSYDREFNWRTMSYPLWSWDIQEGSAFIDGGDGDMYDDKFGTTDMAGQGRLSNGMIDIGAYEYQAIPASRIRYVKPGGSDMNSGDSWDAAYRTIQHAIDALAATPGMPGEVWVAAGTYEPTTYLEDNPNYPASFRMSDGISVYGGFAGTETSKADREIKAGGMPWDFANVTILQGQSYSGEISWNSTDNRWSLNSASTHVVWFAPLLNENKRGFDNVTILDGVTVRGGQATTSQADYYNGDRGAGIYMCVNAWLTNSVVTENVAQGDGGAVWLSGGRVMSSLLFNNSSDSRGGAIYMDRAGIVLRSMLANNSAYEGAGIYMDNNGPWTDGVSHPEYLILSTSIVSNNTSSANGAVYCNKGGVVLQSTITNNSTPRATDMTDENASQSGGLYIDTYTQTINTVLWNNRINGANIQVYVKNPSPANVRFLSTAVASMNNVVWNNTVTEGVLSLSDTNTAGGGQLAPGFSTDGQLTESGIVNAYGVQGDWTTDWTSGSLAIENYWQPVSGSNLRAQGAVLGTMPDVVLIEPEQDLGGSLFAQKPSIGAWEIAQTALNPEVADGGSTLRLYVDVNSTDPDHDGSSWDNAYRSLNEAIAYFASLPESEVGDKQLEIYVKEGDLFPIYAFGNLDPKTATLDIKKTASRLPLRIIGGWSAADGTTRDPLNCRSILEGNQSGTTLADGLYHVVMVEPEANVVLDGFYVTRGYAAGTATITGGAGMLIYDNATVEVRNSVFENNTAVSCAAIDGRQQGVTLTLVNCVINNNTNTDTSAPVVAASTLHLNHVTMVNNIGAAYTATSTSNSFAAGNTSGNTMTFDTMGEAGAANFTNPSNVAGAVMGHDTYYGGYADWTPLTGSTVMASQIINRGTVTTGLDNDIAMHGRDLGGVPDIGAYEAALPESGRVYYVRTPGDGGSDAHSGLSWDDAFATIRKAVDAASRTEVIDGEKAQVWVAAGNYSQDPINGSPNCFEIAEAVNVYGAFPRTGNPSMDERRPFFSTWGGFYNADPTVSPSEYETILRPANDNNDVRRVLGQADMFNPFSDSTEPYYFYVGEGKGDYEAHGDVVEEGELNMPPAGNYLYAKSGTTYYESFNLLGRGENPKELVYVGSGYGEYHVTNDWLRRSIWKSSTGGGYSEFTGVRYYPCAYDVASHYSDGQYMYRKGTSGVDHVGSGKGNSVLKDSEFTYPTTWDGFTIRDGYINSERLRFLDNGIDSNDRGGGKRNGGAGVAFFDNVTIANCVIAGNINKRDNDRQADSDETRGGGVYCDGGTLVNCYVLDNTLGDDTDNTGYGAGVYMYSGTSYNCVIAQNHGYADHSDGAGIFIENAIFFNNTIVANQSHGSSRGTGGICIWNSGGSATLTAYNCISVGNIGMTGGNLGDKDVAVNGGEIICYNSIVGTVRSQSDNGGTGGAYRGVQYNNCIAATTSIFAGASAGNYRIDGDGAGSIAINRGENEPVIGGETYFLMDYTDMDFTARIKDCTIDAGAYEFEQTTATPDANGIYYVTQNGAGTASGESPTEAACASKLQIVLNAAGERVRAGQTATVRLGVPEETGFTFTANTLSNANDPQSYTFVVPYGVQLEGGWDEDFNTRNPYNYPTSLSPVATVGGVTVNGYHAVTFGEPQTGQTGRTTVIDGVVLRDGQATSESGTGNSNARGGGAIVPSWGHVRNCEVRGNRALQGGGLYVMPGGLVTGTLVISNTAEQGAGIYADGTGVDESNRAHLVSVTVTDNDASSAGGGLYLEDGAAMTVNAVVWGNTAPSDKNVSGVLNMPFADAMLSTASGGTIDEFYPMNNCFVETYEIPGNFANTSLESGDEAEVKYFVVGSGTGRTLKDFSPMIKHGSSKSLVQYMITNHGMASTDMQGIARIQDGMDKVDGGAYAFYGGTTSLENVVTRLFVSQTKTVALADGYDEADYRGKSFFTPFTWLDDALLYINEVRKEHPEYENREFEILMAGGTYKPHYRRTAAGDQGASVVDQRLSSFVIPEGVNIYGGFSGTEEIASAGITEIPAADGTITVADGGDINALANARGMSDLNINGVLEAWEFANQTILSGQINEGAATSQNVEHVVYTEGDGQIMLDGLTVNYGDATSGTTTGGAGIYSDGVDCIVKGCRLLNCSAVNGGAAYIRHAGLTLLSSIVAGNRATASGGAVYVDGGTGTASLDAANTVFANNEAASYGGAVATNQTGGTVNVSLINTLMVRNSAGQNYSAICSQPLSTRITNSVIWGNSAGRAFNFGASSFSHSASDDSYFAASVVGNDGNIALNTVNLAIDGPRFRSPSTVAGASGNSTSSLWNPAAISVLTDTGDGQLAYANSDMNSASGGYKDWWDGKTTLSGYSTFYMGDAGYDRYAGPRPTAQDTDPDPKVIDMGAYEYQYDNLFNLDDVYVDLQERGDGSGSSWDNATTDLRGAISALASGEYAGRKATKTVHIRAGEYSPQQLNGGVAYRIQMAGAINANVSVLNIRGAYDETGNQDFGAPTRFVVNPAVGQAGTLLSVNVNTKEVNIEGISFEGATGNGMFITNGQPGDDTTPRVTVRNSAFRGNGTGVYFDQAVAGTDNLFVNTLFADGGTGIDADNAVGQVTVVNATFANNDGAAIEGNADVYNSMSWQCGTGLTTDDTNHNRDFAAIDNSDVARGPNFVNPAGGDYNIRPSIMVLDMGSTELYSAHAGKTPAEDYDLDGAPRLTGDGVDLGAYEYDAELRQVLYVRSGVAGSDESGDSWENAMSDLQGAVDLASIYHNKNNGSDGYVFVHNNVTAADGLRVSMPGVKVYGGMNGESTDGVPADVLARRGSFLNYQRQSTLPGLDITAASVVDGFTITGGVTVGSDGVLSTSVLSSSATAEIDGLLYNSFVEGTVTGTGEAVNVTTPGTLGVATKKNVVENAVANGYVTTPVWEYQLREDSPSIDGGTEDIASYIDKVGHSEDLSGTSRLRGTVDNGCFETWRITSPETITAADRPTVSHVVYVEPGQELSLATGLTTEASPFDVGFLLLQHGAGLVGGGNHVSLGNLAVERTLGGEAGDSWDMAYMPFTITSTTVDGTAYDAAAGTVAVQTYDGRARAAYDYQFSATEGAWSDITPRGNTGMLLRSDDGAAHTVRFYGNSYTESSDAKSVRLTKYNYNDPWASPDDGGDRFTHAENMSWNMFGSPFLCGMNYSDMQYGRVIYSKSGNTFASVNTMDDDAAGGALGAGSAVLTQTATLADYETFEIAPRSAALGDDTARSGNLAVSVMRGDSEAADEFVLTAVPGDEASETFSLANDGVKMMSVDTTASQVYMMRDGHRYSMLSAVDVEGTVPVGLRLTDAGSYAIAIPDDCPAYDYETVILTDNATGRVVDLLDAPYRFNVAAGGDVEGRFTLQFNTSLSEGVGTVNVYSDSEGNVIVEGLETGMRIRLYDASGRMTANRIAASPTETFTGCERGVCLVQVIDGDSEPQVFKAMVNR